MKKTTKDYLKFIDIQIYQDDEMFCVNSDTVLLGMFLDFPKNKTVLDIGTNNGALLLYASRFKPRLLVGIDVLAKALELAKQNLHMNGVEANLYPSKLQDFKHETFDIIITNPPFFKEHNVRSNHYKQVAMFEDGLRIDELFFGLKRLLKDNGAAFVIYPAKRFSEFYAMCQNYDFKIMKLQFVYDTKKNEASRMLVKLKRGKMTSIKILKPLYIRDGKIELDNL